MAINISNKTDIKFQPSLDRKVLEQINSKLRRSLDNAKKKAQRRARRFVEKALNLHPVMVGIRSGGIGPNNLRAEFGLTDAMADEAAKKITEAITKLIDERIKVSQTSTRRVSRANDIRFEIVIKGFDSTDFQNNININEEPFTYTSVNPKRDTKEIIPWMFWILNATREIVGQTNPTIKDWGIKRSDLTIKEKIISRSDEAVMTRSREEADLFPYKLPTIVIPRGKSKNFIDEIINSTSFRKELSTLVSSTILESLKNR